MENKDLASFEVAQALHGYRDGHRLLASSCTLDELSTIEMARMSDLMPKKLALSEYYFCAYPLKSINRYVFACTWSAPEMSRPGCVWTHSLIFDYASVAKAVSLRRFLPLFRRPSTDCIADYSDNICVLTGQANYEVSEKTVDFFGMNYNTALLTEALQRIYFSTRNRIVLSAQPSDKESAIVPILVWDQMPPRLRRDFVFCTAGSVRSLTPSSLVTLMLSEDSEDTDEKYSEGSAEALDVLVTDAFSSTRTELRAFISRYVSDIGDARTGVAKLVLIATALFQESTEAGLRNASQRIVDWLGNPVEARLLKREMLTGALLDIRLFNEQVQYDLLLDNVLPQFRSLKILSDDSISGIFINKYFAGTSDEELKLRISKLIRICWNSTADSFGRHLLQLSINSCPVSLVAALTFSAEIKLFLGSLDSRLLSENDYWSSFETEPTFEDWETLKKLGSLEMLAFGLLSGRMYAPVSALLHEYPERVIPCLADFLVKSGADIQREILSAFRAERTEFIRYLARKNDANMQLLYPLAEDIFYVSYPQINASEWLNLFSNDRSKAFINPYLAYVLFDQAATVSRDAAAQLYKLSFNVLHSVENHSDIISSKVTERIYQTLSRDYNNAQTDVASRIRKRFCDFYQNYPSFEEFMSSVSGDDVLKMLFETMIGLWRGREWLEGLEHAYETGQVQLTSAQKSMLSKLLEKKKKNFFRLW